MAKTWQCLVLKSTTTAEKSYSQKLTWSQALCTFSRKKLGGCHARIFNGKLILHRFCPGDLQTSFRTWLEASYVHGTILNVDGGWLAR